MQLVQVKLLGHRIGSADLRGETVCPDQFKAAMKGVVSSNASGVL